MKWPLLAALCLLPASAIAVHAQDPAAADPAEAARLKADADARWARLQAEAAAERERRRAAQERYQQGVRDAEAAQARHEAEMARHREALERAREADADYQRRRAEYEAATANRRTPSDDRRDETLEAPVPTAGESTCEERSRRNRRRGRTAGGALGGVAGIVGGRRLGTVARILAVPVGTLIGDAIARLLDCEEQQQAAAATERAVEGGVGTTASWTSESRPGVSGSSTVLALQAEADGGQCMTVTDIVIIDGEETRAPKRMCRRPPSNRFVRV